MSQFGTSFYRELMTGSRGRITYNIKVVTIVQSQPAAIIVLTAANETAKIKTIRTRAAAVITYSIMA
ncbi:MAG TPA: hypothetical protein PKJ80_02180 [Candidatus Saccharicenans sp.]|nr:hypothetical protein [Candidatus Saccharicenans sp.]